MGNKIKEIRVIELRDPSLRQDYISMDHKTAISSEGVIFKIGDKVKHQGESEDETAFIKGFRLDYDSMDILAETTKGYAKISFLYH